MPARLSKAVLLLLLASLAGTPAEVSGQNFRVFLRIADPETGTVAEVSDRLRGAIEGAGWTVLSSHEAGVRAEDCAFRAQVFTVNWPEYTRVAMSQGTHGAFAAPLRISVFEDELGVHVVAVNPQSINRTIVAEEGMGQEWTRLAQELRQTLAQGMGETPVDGQLGQRRGEGRIGRTMGIMAGGPFLGKLKEVATIPVSEGSVQEVAERIYSQLQAAGPGKEWGMRPVFNWSISDDVAVLGFTGEEMEASSFSIVGRGADKSRSDMACPGLDHSAAYPLNVLLARVGEEIEITLVDEMYRMKMFFEDAGKMKFARNMGMPGSIEDEIKDMIRASLF